MTFLLISVVVLNLAAFLMPKRLKKTEMYATSFFAFTLAIVTDIVLDLKLDLYGYFKKGLDLQGFLAFFGLYPSTNIIFLNTYAFARKRQTKLLVIFSSSLLALVYEWAAIKSGYFYHNGWKLWYSAIAYPILYFILWLNLKFFRKLDSWDKSR